MMTLLNLKAAVMFCVYVNRLKCLLWISYSRETPSQSVSINLHMDAFSFQMHLWQQLTAPPLRHKTIQQTNEF